MLKHETTKLNTRSKRQVEERPWLAKISNGDQNTSEEPSYEYERKSLPM